MVYIHFYKVPYIIMTQHNHRSIFKIVLFLISYVVVVPQFAAAQYAAGKWSEVKSSDGSMPVERHEAAYIAVGDKFYLMSGRGIRPVSIFDPKTETWTAGAKPPVEMHHLQPVVYKDKIYIIGALTGNYPGETPLPDVYIYDPAKDMWTKGDPIPADRQRGSTGVVVYKDKIYVVCGIKDGHRGDHKTWLDSYDPKTGKWEKLADAPRARDHFQASVVKNKLYVVGGRRSEAPDNVFGNKIQEVDVYDFKTGKWSTLSQHLPTTRAGSFNVVLGKQIVVIGGESGEQELAHNEVETLNTKTGTWISFPPIPEGRHGSGAILYKNAVYIASGCGKRGGSPELKTQWKYVW